MSAGGRPSKWRSQAATKPSPRCRAYASASQSAFSPPQEDDEDDEDEGDEDDDGDDNDGDDDNSGDGDGGDCDVGVLVPVTVFARWPPHPSLQLTVDPREASMAARVSSYLAREHTRRGRGAVAVLGVCGFDWKPRLGERAARGSHQSGSVARRNMVDW